MDWDKFFFSDIGKKIKAIIRGCFYFESILILISGALLEIFAFCNLMFEGDIEYFLILVGVPVGVVLAIGTLWLSILLLYGFAEIVDTAIVNRKEQLPTQTNVPAPQPAPQPAPAPVQSATVPKKDPRAFSTEDYWVCKACSTKNQKDRTVCWCCDSVKDEDEDEDWMDVDCPHCGEKLSFLKGTTLGLCPNCDHPFNIG